MQDFVNAVSAEVPNVIGETVGDALTLLQAAADTVGSGAVVNYGVTPDVVTDGEGTVIITFNGENSTPISVDIIA